MTSLRNLALLATMVISGCAVGDPEPGPSTGGNGDPVAVPGSDAGTPTTGTDPCATDPDSDACYCSQNPTDPDCSATPDGGTTQPTMPDGGTGDDPCTTDPDGDACYCQQTPDDPYCQQDPNGGTDACTTNPISIECYCEFFPDDEICQP